MAKRLLGNRIGLELGDPVPFTFHDGLTMIGHVADLRFHDGFDFDTIRATVDFGNGAIVEGTPDTLVAMANEEMTR